MNKCIFLDRDGVINEDRGTYTFRIRDFKVMAGVKKGLSILKDAGYILVVVTNQAGISRGLFSESDMQKCHDLMMEETGHLIDDIYYATYYPEFSDSLMRKPESLMFEKAIAKYNIDPSHSWMIGNSSRDLEPAIKLGIRTVFIGDHKPEYEFDLSANDLLEAAGKIMAYQNMS